MKIFVVKGSEKSSQWEQKISNVLSQINQITGDDVQ